MELFNSIEQLNSGQREALAALRGQNNVFLTGAAGSGKSFLIRTFLRERDIPILASTGAAAILVGGRTFHSFFGIGIMEGGEQATLERAMRNKKLIKRLRKTDAVIIDEISMLSGPTLRVAERVCQLARENTTAWGGIRIIAVGDFAQLPPVNPHSRVREWAFLDEVWERSEFETVVLSEIMRTADQEFLEVLNYVRKGQMNSVVTNFLNSRRVTPPSGDFTRLFSRKNRVEEFNLERLAEIPHNAHTFQTIYEGKEKDIENFRKNSPIADLIQLKVDALVMMRQNDVDGQWVNGSLGRVLQISPELLTIELLSGGVVEVEKTKFTLLDAEGNPVVIAQNFPVSLAWAMTIHKAQGATLDRMLVNLDNIWEPGQAYVALSRARTAEGLFIESWNPRSVFADKVIAKFL